MAEWADRRRMGEGKGEQGQHNKLKFMYNTPAKVRQHTVARSRLIMLRGCDLLRLVYSLTAIGQLD